jgi:hypothetical protein
MCANVLTNDDWFGGGQTPARGIFDAGKMPQKDDRGQALLLAAREEVALLEEASHPSIVEVYSSWETGTDLHIAMEFAARGDAFDIVDF